MPRGSVSEVNVNRGELLLWLAVVQEALYILDQLPPNPKRNEDEGDYSARVNQHLRDQVLAKEFLQSDACKVVIDHADEVIGWPSWERFCDLRDEKIRKIPEKKPRKTTTRNFVQLLRNQRTKSEKTQAYKNIKRRKRAA